MRVLFYLAVALILQLTTSCLASSQRKPLLCGKKSDATVLSSITKRESGKNLASDGSDEKLLGHSRSERSEKSSTFGERGFGKRSTSSRSRIDQNSISYSTSSGSKNLENRPEYFSLSSFAKYWQTTEAQRSTECKRRIILNKPWNQIVKFSSPEREVLMSWANDKNENNVDDLPFRKMAWDLALGTNVRWSTHVQRVYNKWHALEYDADKKKFYSNAVKGGPDRKTKNYCKDDANYDHSFKNENFKPKLKNLCAAIAKEKCIELQPFLSSPKDGKPVLKTYRCDRETSLNQYRDLYEIGKCAHVEDTMVSYLLVCVKPTGEPAAPYDYLLALHNVEEDSRDVVYVYPGERLRKVSHILG